MKNWMTYLNALRPAADRHWGAGPDSDHQRMAAELSAMSQDEETYHAPYDQRMGDRFLPQLSTR